MSHEKCPPPAATGQAGESWNQANHIPLIVGIKGHEPRVDLLLILLDGATHATAIMPWGKPGPIRLPDDIAGRRILIEAHLRGEPATVAYSSTGKSVQWVKVEPLVMGALCPAADGLCRWVGIDLDGASHGAGGLADPTDAARCIAERASAAGLADGLVIARSRSGVGRHVWLIPPFPVQLAGAVLVVAQLAVQACRVASRDVDDDGGPHAFRCADGSIATLGESGQVELIPRGDEHPPMGWPLSLPLAGAFREHGGGVLVDPLTDRPVDLDRVPRCNADAWDCFLRETKADYARRAARTKRSSSWRRTSAPRHARDLVDRLPDYAREFIVGNVREGERGNRAFAAACALLGVGLPIREVETLVLHGARGCGLPEREAQAAIQSAARRKGVSS